MHEWKIRMPPLSAFGVWWSRYYPYSGDQFISEVVAGIYANNSLPLHHVVLDVDWHTRSPAGCPTDSQGGYSWNLSLFPDPASFIGMLQSSANPIGAPLTLALNLHPQHGVDKCQDQYEKFADAIGIDPSSGVKIFYFKKKALISLFRFFFHLFLSLFFSCFSPFSLSFFWFTTTAGDD